MVVASFLIITASAIIKLFVIPRLSRFGLGDLPDRFEGGFEAVQARKPEESSVVLS